MAAEDEKREKEEENKIREEVRKNLAKKSENLQNRKAKISELTEEQEEWLNAKLRLPNYEKKEQITHSEWYTEHVIKYQHLRNVVEQNLPGLWDSLEFEISIQKILNIKDCTLPFAGIVLGRPSSLKTVGIGMFRKWKHSFYTDNFSARAFVSHSTAVKREQLEKIDLLPKIRNNLLLTPELVAYFYKKRR